MRQRSTLCPISGCPNEKQPTHVMCAAHWTMVSPATQREVYKAWSRVLKYHGEERLSALKAHQQVCKKACEEAGHDH